MLGATLGPYRIVSKLGAGGMGAVYLADGPAGRVALKVVLPDLEWSEKARRRFLREGEIGMRLRHENIVATLEAGEAQVDGQPVVYLAMEYVEGQTLKSLVAEVGRVPEELCRHVGREVAKALAAIHAVGAIHRDVKPENVIIACRAAAGSDHVAERPRAQPSVSDGHVHPQEDYVVKLMDLGVAKDVEESVRLSSTGDFAGTLMYAAPEQVRGDAAVDGRVDLHSLGLLLFEIATGEHAYRAADVPGMLAKLLHEDARRVAELNPQLSPFFEEVVHTLLAKAPENRFRSAALLLRALDEGEGGAWWADRVKSIRQTTHRPLRRVGVAAETPMHGRDAELALLRPLFDRAAAGDGQVVLVEGEPGIGKTRLVSEFAAALKRDGSDFHFLHGEWPPAGIAAGAEAFAQAFQGQFGDGASATGLSRALKGAPALVPAFAALLRGDASPTGEEPLARDAVRTVFVRAAASLAQERTTVLFVDGLHDAPAEGRAIFAALAHATTGRRLLVIGASRPGLPATWIADVAGMAHSTRIVLDRLPDADAARIVQHVLRPRSPMDELPSQVVAKADGNPLCVFEILRGLRESGLVRQNPDGMLVRTGATGVVQIPSTLLGMTAARLAGLPQEEREILEVASCCGIEFDPSAVGDVLGMPRIPLLRALARIEKQHRLVRSAGMRFAFDHVQVREALYVGLSEPLRCEYHAALGASVERRAADAGGAAGALAVEACGHFLRGTDPRKALPHLDAALQRLTRGGAYAAGVELADLALAVPGLLVGPPRFEVVRSNANRFDMLGRRDDERKALDESLRLAKSTGDPAALLTVYRAMGWHLTKISKYDAAQQWLSDSIEMARAQGDRAAEGHAIRLLGIVYSHLGRFEDSQEHYERSRDIAREIGDRNGEAGACINLGIDLFARGRFDEARAEAERGLELARELGNRRWETNATTSLLTASLALGRYDEAVAMCERGLALARETGYRKAEEIALGNFADVLTAMGDPARATECVANAQALSRELGDRESEGVRLGQLAAINEMTGDEVAAERSYRDAIALQRAVGDPRGGAQAMLRLGSMLRRAGRLVEARPLIDEALEVGRRVDLVEVVALAAIESALCPGGDVTVAQATFDAHSSRLEMSTRMRVHFLLWQATHAPAHLDEAGRLLDHLVAHAPSDRREAMVDKVRLHREIAQARRTRGA